MVEQKSKVDALVGVLKGNIDEAVNIHKKVQEYTKKANEIGAKSSDDFTKFLKKERLLAGYEWVYATNERFMYLISKNTIEPDADILKLMSAFGIEEIPFAEGMSISLSDDSHLLITFLDVNVAVAHIKDLGMKIDFSALKQSREAFEKLYNALTGTQGADIIIAQTIPDNVVRMKR